MTVKRWRRKVRCLLKHGPRRCPHIERHSRRRKRRKRPLTAAPPLPAALSEQRPMSNGRHALPLS
jgi:hypothetical protein